ncbi:hypothetical protein VTN96DRAFT_2529 [Rasamsonia emersonii]
MKPLLLSMLSAFLFSSPTLSSPQSASKTENSTANTPGIRLINGHEHVLIQPWGADGFRVRATLNRFPDNEAYSVIIDPPLDGPQTSPSAPATAPSMRHKPPP